MKIEAEVISLIWSGPYKMDDFLKESKNQGSGVYQIYGTHNIYGPDTLLYIGKTEKNSFGERISWHNEEWTYDEGSDVDIYLGCIDSKERMNKSKRNNQIDRAERLLIYYATPPYCSKGKKSFGKMPPTILLNYRRRKRVPYVISSIYEQFDPEQNE